jgi:hypothetical protein
MFMAMFAFYLLSIMFFPASVHYANGVFTYYPIDEQPYVLTVLTLPIIVVTALGLDALLASNKKPLIIAVVAIISVVIICDIIALNNDISYYRVSMYTLHAFVDYVATHPSGTYHANWLFASEANLISSYKYNISSLKNCSSAYINSLPQGTYIATGGTISLAMSPTITQSFDSCVLNNMTDYSLVASVNNPLGSYPGMYGPPLEIYAIKTNPYYVPGANMTAYGEHRA